MLSNAYFLAKFRFGTAENEPAKNLQNFAKFANFADPNQRGGAPGPGARATGEREPHARRPRQADAAAAAGAPHAAPPCCITT